MTHAGTWVLAAEIFPAQYMHVHIIYTPWKLDAVPVEDATFNHLMDEFQVFKSVKQGITAGL